MSTFFLYQWSWDLDPETGALYSIFRNFDFIGVRPIVSKFQKKEYSPPVTGLGLALLCIRQEKYKVDFCTAPRKKKKTLKSITIISTMVLKDWKYNKYLIFIKNGGPQNFHTHHTKLCQATFKCFDWGEFHKELGLVLT